MKKLLAMLLLPFMNLQLFNNTNITGDSGMSAEMKTFYDKDLIENAKPKLVHNQFGQKRPIPKGKGKTIEFRKFDPLPKALTPLTEGVTPNGKKMNVTSSTATVAQYGDYIEFSDMIEMTAIDRVLVEGNRMLGQQAGETLDTITREVLNGGSNVLYADGRVAARYLLEGGNATWATNHYFSCECIRRIVLGLKNAKAATLVNGMYVIIIHPDQEYTLKKDTEWQEAVKYQKSEKIFDGEIGEYDGAKIVVTTESKIFHAADLSAANRNLTVASLATKTFTVQEALTAGDVAALVGRKLIVKGYLYTVASAVAGAAGAATVTVNETVSGTPGNGEKVYPGEAGKDGRDVYSALGIGSDAYGTTEIEGGGLQMIAKQLGSAGSADALNQRSTQGWKATHVAKILTDAFLVRCENTTPYQSGAN